MASDDGFKREFFNQLRPNEPLDAGDPRYVTLDSLVPGKEAPRGLSVVPLLRNTIEFSDRDTAQLISGFPGSGKSTELKRLVAELGRAGHIALYVDLLEYVNQSAPLGIADLLISIAGAVGEAAEKRVGTGRFAEGSWTALGKFLQSEVGIEEFGLPFAEVKVRLRQEATFKQKLNEHLRARLGQLNQAVRGYVAEVVAALLASGSSRSVVCVFDSLEKVRPASYANALEVFKSVEVVFAGHAESLRLPCHVIYTVPPYLGVMRPGIGDLYSGPIRVMPMVKVAHRDAARSPFEDGITTLTDLVARRGDWTRLLGPDPASLRVLIGSSGGYLRDLFRLLREVLLVAPTLPAGEAEVAAAVANLRRELVQITVADAKWLALIAGSRDSHLPSLAELPRLATLLDTHLVLCYQNGGDWYDVHPLVREEAIRLAGSAAT